MESFRPLAPLCLACCNLQTEWASFEKKFRWFLIAIGANEKPDATKLAMLFSTVGDDAVKVFEAFTYQEGESCDTFDVVIYGSLRNTVRLFAMSCTSASCSGNTQLYRGGQYDTNHTVFTCPDARLEERLPR